MHREYLQKPYAEAIFRFYAKESGVKADVSSYGLFINPEECETRGQALIAVRKLNIPIRKKKSKVITEDVVKIALSVAVYNHYKRIYFQNDSDVELQKSNILQIGRAHV